MDESSFNASFDMPGRNNPYLQDTIEWINSHEEKLWEHLDRVIELERVASTAILSRFLEQACECQNEGNIRIGRYGIAALPRQWVLDNIERVAEPMLHRGSHWEWRRLLEVYRFLDAGLTRKVAIRAVASDDEEVREIGSDYLQ